MADESTLVRVADLARTLRALCPETVNRLKEEEETLRWCRNEQNQAPDWMRDNARHGHIVYRAACDQCAGMLRGLLALTYRHLPAEGRALRELCRVDAPLDAWDWDAAARELHHIEVTALATATPAAEAPTATKPAKRRRGMVNAEMLDMLTRNPECRGWTITQWTIGIKRSRGAICKTKTWKELKAARDLIAAEHATTKRRRSPGRRK